jgi:hypothetical protein
MTNAEAIFATVFTYWVEILHPGSTDWTHIHCPDWETCNAYADAMAYAIRVRDDHPGSQVRIIERAEGLPDDHIRVA